MVEHCEERLRRESAPLSVVSQGRLRLVGQRTCQRNGETLGYEVPLLAQLPLDIRLREGSDTGTPATVADGGKPAADAPAALELSRVAQPLGHVKRGLSGMRLGVSPVNS